MGEGFFNENWIKYSQDSPVRSWGASKSSGLSSDQINSIEIINDDGKNIKGVFSFEGREEEDETRKMITNGDFSFTY